MGELKNVKITAPSPGHDFGWYDPGWDDSFSVTISWPTATCQQMLDERRCDLNLTTIIPFAAETDPPDVLLTEVSSPDEHGFCSFGASLWTKKKQIAEAKLTIAEANKNLIRTYGENFVHVSEIDYFVEHIPTAATPGMGSLGGRVVKEPEPYVKQITEIVSVQNMYNLSARGAEPLLDAATERGVGFIPWFPLAAGPLAAADGPLQRIAADHHATPSQLALAWLLKRSPVMLPIPGTSKVAHLEENVAAAEITLSDDEFETLAAAGAQ